MKIEPIPTWLATVLKGNTEATTTYQGQNQALSNTNIIHVLCDYAIYYIQDLDVYP